MGDIINMADRGGLPNEGRRQQASTGRVTEESEGRRIVEQHRRRLQVRRLRDATSEKYAMHVDGEGGAQWLDLYHGHRMRMVPRLRGAPRMQDNQLRPILDNMIAHLTTQPFRFVVDSRKDKDSRERALMDQMIINYHVRTQRWNQLVAEAKYIAACYGFCPIHQMVRDDTSVDTFEGARPAGGMMEQPAADGGMMEQQIMGGGEGDVSASDHSSGPAPSPPPILLDAWCGNPWDMAFDAGAKRWSINRCTFGRILPTEMVKEAFGRNDIEGDRYRSSASQFQMIAQRWAAAGSGVHGTATLQLGERDEELTGLVYEEIPPGVDTQWPNGKLSIVALQGSSTTQHELGRTHAGRSLLLWEGELPGSTYSWVPFYSHWRMDDPLGKPFIADLDDDQIHLNQLESMADEFLRRANKPPLASSGAINVETLDYSGDTVLEVEPMGTPGEVELRYLEYPARHLGFLENKIGRVKEGMYRKGAYQAASRGEGKSGESGKAIIALQSADDSILGPLAMITQNELEDFAILSHRLLRDFLDVGMVVDIVGEELSHIAEPYVDRNMLSTRDPAVRLVSGFGTSTESRAQQLLNLHGVADASGKEILTTRQLHQKWPDQGLFGEQDDPQEYRERHARVVNQAIERAAEEFRQMYPQLPETMNDPMVLQAAQMAWQYVDHENPILMDDDIQAHLEALTLITQDDTQDALVRHIAMLRQDQYWAWLAAQQAAAAEAQMGMAQGGDEGMSGGSAGGPGPAATRESGTPGADSMVQQDSQFSKRARTVRSA